MYDAVLVVSFGGPERSEDVIPFLENVTRGRNIPPERLRAVAEHYYHFGGKSPINDQCRELIAALRAELDQNNIRLPIYWGNRNWHPFLSEAFQEMRAGGVKRALALVTSAYSSYSGCRQYRENIASAQAEASGETPSVDKLRVFYNHPGFIASLTDRVNDALSNFAGEDRSRISFVATAHSIPCSMAETSDYEKQLRETTRLVAEATGFQQWDLVFQSRSGSPAQPWLEPDILDHLRSLQSRGITNVLVAPLGFVSDHLEVVYDLDYEASELAQKLGIKMVRARTAGTHPAFVTMLRQLIAERLFPNEPKLATGIFGANHDVCPVGCCPAPPRAGTPRVLEVPAASPLA
jgi:protoporphyrin/coproporphyrin ferrochelatase